MVKIRKKIAELEKQLASLKHRNIKKNDGTVKEQISEEKELEKLYAEKEKVRKATEEAKVGKKGLGKFWTGFRGALRQGAINKSISETRRLQNLGRQEKLLTKQEKVMALQARVRDKRNATMIDYNKLTSMPVNTSPIKTINAKDIFG